MTRLFLDHSLIRRCCRSCARAHLGDPDSPAAAELREKIVAGARAALETQWVVVRGYESIVDQCSQILEFHRGHDRFKAC